MNEFMDAEEKDQYISWIKAKKRIKPPKTRRAIDYEGGETFDVYENREVKGFKAVNKGLAKLMGRKKPQAAENNSSYKFTVIYDSLVSNIQERIKDIKPDMQEQEAQNSYTALRIPVSMEAFKKSLLSPLSPDIRQKSK